MPEVLRGLLERERRLLGILARSAHDASRAWMRGALASRVPCRADLLTPRPRRASHAVHGLATLLRFAIYRIVSLMKCEEVAQTAAEIPSG